MGVLPPLRDAASGAIWKAIIGSLSLSLWLAELATVQLGCNLRCNFKLPPLILSFIPNLETLNRVRVHWRVS